MKICRVDTLQSTQLLHGGNVIRNRFLIKISVSRNGKWRWKFDRSEKYATRQAHKTRVGIWEKLSVIMKCDNFNYIFN